jgi:type III secretory pathway lipoprotein EscJ
VTLAHGLSEREAQDLSAALNRRGVAVTQDRDGASDRYTIQVAQSAVALAWDAVHAQCSDQHTPPSAAAALLSTREAELRAQEHHLEANISRAIEALPHVHSAAVLITLARSDPKLTDLLRPPPSAAARAVVSLVCAEHRGCPQVNQLQALLSAAVPGLTNANIRILQQTQAQPEPACAKLGNVGPLTVTRASLPTLKLWLAASLVVHMLGSIALLLLVQKRRRQQPHA